MMKGIDPEALSGRENYKFLTGSVIPRPVAFVTTLSESGVLNAAPFSFFNVVTANPPLLSVAVQRDRGIRKDTARHAIQRGEFVVHISTENYIEEINKTAVRFPCEKSEVDVTSLTPVESTKISVPAIKEATIRMECVLERAIELGEADGGPTCDLLIGRVVYYHIEEPLYEKGRIDPIALHPICRLAGNTYAKLGDLFDLVRPEEKL